MKTANLLEPIEKLFLEIPKEAMGAGHGEPCPAARRKSRTWTITATM